MAMGLTNVAWRSRFKCTSVVSHDLHASTAKWWHAASHSGHLDWETRDILLSSKIMLLNYSKSICILSFWGPLYIICVWSVSSQCVWAMVWVLSCFVPCRLHFMMSNSRSRNKGWQRRVGILDWELCESDIGVFTQKCNYGTLSNMISNVPHCSWGTTQRRCCITCHTVNMTLLCCDAWNRNLVKNFCLFCVCWLW